MKARLRAAILFACALLFVSSVAHAQMSEGEKKAAARAAYQEGIQLQDQGKPADALAKFEAAQKLFDAPTHLLHIAECQALLGKLVEASETYESLIRKPLPPGSPEAFTQAQEQARAELPPLRQRIPQMRVNVKPDSQTLQNLTITINDKQMPNELVGIQRPVNPGSYRLAAAANGWATRTPVDVEVREKEAKNVDLVLQQTAGGAVVAPVPPPYGAGGATAGPPAGGAPADGQSGAEQPKPAPKPADGPSQTGLLFGAHGGIYVPSGKVANNTGFDRVASGGGGIGIDFLARFARVLLVGARAEGLFLGGPDPSTFDRGQTITSSTTMWGGAVILGILPRSDRVTFYGDIGYGYRALQYSQSAPISAEASYTGTYFALGAGVSIPAGPIRIVPKVGLDLGSLEPSEVCVGANCVTASASGFTNVDRSGGYQMFSVGLALFWNVDLGKRHGQ